jgi:hypothetical protein
MLKRKQRSVNQLKTSSQRVKEIIQDVDRLQERNLSSRVAILASQQRNEGLRISLDETLEKQDQNLDKLMKLAYMTT